MQSTSLRPDAKTPMLCNIQSNHKTVPLVADLGYIASAHVAVNRNFHGIHPMVRRPPETPARVVREHFLDLQPGRPFAIQLECGH